MKTEEDEEFERIEREQAKGWRKRQIEDEKEKRCPTCNKLIDDEDVKNDWTAKKTCSVCRLRPAEKQVRTSDGRVQWRCMTCHDLKNRIGFSKGKQ